MSDKKRQAALPRKQPAPPPAEQVVDPTLAAGGQSSARHTHSKQDEFMMVLSGELVLETDEGRQTLGPGMCAGFPAGGGNAHRFLNLSDRDATFLVVGDRTPGDEGTYPDIDLAAGIGPDGRYVFTRKDGTPY